MANQIERDVYVTYEPLKNPISYVRGTNALPIIFHFRDYDIPDGAAANVVVVKPSGKGVYNPAAISGNDVTVTVDQQMFIELGTSELQVSITQGDSELVTFSQPVWVKPNYKDGDFPPSESSSEFLDDILNGANEAVQKADAALANAETALQDATQASTTAQQAASTAQSASTTANQASTTAQQAATDAQTALANANQALQDADQAIQSVQESVQNMNTNFASLANTAEISTLTTDNQTAAGAINELMAIKAPGIPITATGEQISMDDASGNKFLGLKIYGKGEQVKTTGAQLLPNYRRTQYTINGVTYIPNEDGSITLRGVADAIIPNDFMDSESFLLKAGQYTLSSEYKTGVLAQLRSTNGITTFASVESQIGNVQFSIENDTEVKFRYYISSGANTDGTYYPMLNAGSSPLPWEPYTGGQPSPSVAYPQEVQMPGQGGSMNVNVTGKNLLDINNIQNGLLNTNNGNVIANDSWRYSDYIAVPKKRSVFVSQEESNNYLQINFCRYDQNKNFISSDTVGKDSISGYKFETENANFIRVSWSLSVSGQPVTRTNMQIEFGESRTTYEPYKPVQTLPITTTNGFPGIPVESGGNYVDENGQQWISDVRDEEAGKYTQNIKIINAKDIEWYDTWNSIFNDPTGETHVFNTSGSQYEGDYAFCNFFNWGNFNIPSNGINIFSTQQGNGSIGLRVSSDIAASVEEWDQLVSSNNIVFYVILKTPIVTDLPAEETAAYNAMHTNYPNTNIFTDQDVQPGMEAEYVGDTQIYIDKKFQTLQDSISNLVAEETSNFINNANVTDITQLGTTSKTLVGAINEINNK